jgi:hypothetical protein
MAGGLELAQISQRVCRDTAVLYLDALGTQTSGLLFMCARRYGKCNASSRADHPMPGQVEILGCHAKGKPGLARAPGQSCGASNGSIGCRLSARNRADHMPNGLERGIVVRRHRSSRTRRAQRPPERSRRALPGCHQACDDGGERRRMLVAMVTTEARSLKFPGTTRVVDSFANLPN